jgi:hypothetical protein
MYPEWYPVMVAVVVGGLLSFFMVKAYRAKVAERAARRAEKEARKRR